jgi:hypothetical protein
MPPNAGEGCSRQIRAVLRWPDVQGNALGCLRDATGGWDLAALTYEHA